MFITLCVLLWKIGLFPWSQCLLHYVSCCERWIVPLFFLLWRIGVQRYPLFITLIHIFCCASLECIPANNVCYIGEDALRGTVDTEMKSLWSLDIALHALPTARNVGILISVFSVHCIFQSLKLEWCVMWTMNLTSFSNLHTYSDVWCEQWNQLHFPVFEPVWCMIRTMKSASQYKVMMETMKPFFFFLKIKMIYDMNSKINFIFQS